MYGLAHAMRRPVWCSSIGVPFWRYGATVWGTFLALWCYGMDVPLLELLEQRGRDDAREDRGEGEGEGEAPRGRAHPPAEEEQLVAVYPALSTDRVVA
eukprot:2569495-Rhodomonas_salina.1